MDFANLQALCAAKGTNPSALVKHLGMSTGNLKNWRSGINPSVEVAQKMCAVLGCTMDELLGTEKQTDSVQKKPTNAEKIGLLDEVQDLSKEEAAKVLEYAQLIKLKRSRKP